MPLSRFSIAASFLERKFQEFKEAYFENPSKPASQIRSLFRIILIKIFKSFIGNLELPRPPSSRQQTTSKQARFLIVIL